MPAQESSGNLVAFADCELIGIDSQKMLVINRVNGKQQFLSPGVVEALKTCTTFDNLQSHTKRICAVRPALRGQEAAVGSTLKQLSDTGFLLQSDELRRRLVAAPKRNLAPSQVFIITCDRPQAVERLLESMLRAGNLSRHNALFLIDDSRRSEHRKANQDLVEEFNLRSAKDMEYFGEQKQHALLQRLVGDLPEHEAGIRFLLDAHQWQGYKTYGRARTLSLLLSVGYRAVVMDDDILCQAIHAPIQGSGISLTGQREAAFYPDKEALVTQGIPADFDPLSGHLSYLGQNIGCALKELSGGEITNSMLQNTNAAMLNELHADSPLLVTQCGSWGDPGTRGAHWALNLNEASIERLVNAPHGMANALENRCNWLGCQRPTLHKMASMSQLTGIDNTHLIPPYFPAFRGEDLLFGSMVESMYHHGAALEYSWSVPHFPIDERGGRSLRDPIARSDGIALFSRYLTEHIDYKDFSDPDARLHSMGEDARRLAARSDHNLLLDYRTEQAKVHAESLQRLLVQAQRAEELPSMNWQSYLQRAIEELEQSLTKMHSPTEMTGSPDISGERELLNLFRRFACGWANAISAWPAMRDAMRP
jgi:hypothetical protein